MLNQTLRHVHLDGTPKSLYFNRHNSEKIDPRLMQKGVEGIVFQCALQRLDSPHTQVFTIFTDQAGVETWRLLEGYRVERRRVEYVKKST